MAGVEDLPLGFHKGFHLANQRRSSNPRDLVVECAKVQSSESRYRKWAGPRPPCLIRPGEEGRALALRKDWQDPTVLS